VRFRVILALTAAVMLAAGCAGTSNGDAPAAESASDSYSGPAVITEAPSETDPASDPAAATSARPSKRASSSAGRSSAPVTGLAGCGLPYLSVTAKPASGGDSHAGVVLTFANTGQIACQLQGYPGVAVLNASGQQVQQAARTPAGYLGGIRNGKPPFPTTVVGPGSVASALLEGEVVDVNGKSCASQAGLLVTPPNTRVAAKVRRQIAFCGGLQIHPVVPGATGNKS
jgi:hypothetical protein